MANIIEIASKSPLTNKTIKVNKIPVEIKTFVNVDTFVEMANTIANSCFDEKNEYRPEYYDIAKRYAVLDYLTNINLDGVSTEEVFKMTQNDWYYEIEKACFTIIYEIEEAADKIIAYRLSARKTSFDNLCDNLSEIIGQDMTQNLADVKEVLNSIDKIDAKKFAQAAVNNNLAKNKGGEDNGNNKTTAN